MSSKQIEMSAARLREVSQRDGDMFWQMQVEAASQIRRAVAMRREAWAIYHQYFQKRGTKK